MSCYPSSELYSLDTETRFRNVISVTLIEKLRFRTSTVVQTLRCAIWCQPLAEKQNKARGASARTALSYRKTCSYGTAAVRAERPLPATAFLVGRGRANAHLHEQPRLTCAPEFSRRKA